MATFMQKRFNGGTAILDGNTYDTCSFVGVRLVFNGTAPFSFAFCDFIEGTTLELGEPAAMIAYTIGGLWRHSQLGPQIQQLVLNDLPEQRKSMN